MGCARSSRSARRGRCCSAAPSRPSQPLRQKTCARRRPGTTDFPDVDRDATSSPPRSSALGGYGIADGFTDGEYKPGSTSTVVRWRSSSTTWSRPRPPARSTRTPPNPFTDVAEDGVFEAFISALADAGIVDGVSDTTYAPGGDVTRGEMAKFIANAIEAVTGHRLRRRRTTPSPSPTSPTTARSRTSSRRCTRRTSSRARPRRPTTRAATSTAATMAVFIMRAAEYLENNGAGLRSRANQTFTVTPADEATNDRLRRRRRRRRPWSRVSTRSSGLDDTATYDIVLFPAENVTDTNGVVTFNDDDEHTHGRRRRCRLGRDRRRSSRSSTAPSDDAGTGNGRRRSTSRRSTAPSVHDRLGRRPTRSSRSSSLRQTADDGNRTSTWTPTTSRPRPSASVVRRTGSRPRPRPVDLDR